MLTMKPCFYNDNMPWTIQKNKSIQTAFNTCILLFAVVLMIIVGPF